MCPAPPLAGEGQGSGGFRADIEGLRAVAVLLVMLCHAGVPGLSGGFIGVDVFFVISGFLITGLLVREVDDTRRISLRRFWARRAKRLLPASATVLLATAVLTVLLVPSPRWSTIGGDIVAAALYVVNWRFAHQSVAYLQADTAASSPVQHYWSLAVEEQFYLLWPLLILLCAEVARQLSLRLRTTLVAGILLVIVPSLLWSIHDTATSPEPAYFATPTRLWELGIGALIALFVPFWLRSTRGAATMLAWGGLATLLLSALTITQDVAWPSSNALMPALATAAVIVGGFRAREAGPLRVLGTRVLQRIGALSYSLYLWHWPLVAIASARWGEPSWPVRLALVAASAGPAWLTYVLLEDPVRRSALLSRAPRVALMVGAACTAVGVGVGLGLGGFAQTQVRAAPAGEARGAAAAIAAPATPDLTHPGSIPTASGGAGASGGRPGAAASPTTPPTRTQPSPPHPPPPRRSSPWRFGPAVNPVLAGPPRTGLLDLTPTSITPDPVKAVDDRPKETCLVDQDSTRVRRCELGDRSGRLTLAVVGDSKVDQWIDLFDQIARRHQIRLDAYTKAGCAFSAAPIQRGSAAYGSCTTWTAKVMGELTGLHRPSAVLVSGQEVRAYDGAGRPGAAQMVDGYVTQWKRLQSKGIRVVALADVPTPPAHVVDCVSRYRSAPDYRCAFPRNAGMGTPALTAAARRTRVPLFSVNDWVCPQASCPPVIGNVLVYRSGNHITATYAATLVEVMRTRLITALAATSP
ncbi:acyltransferase family protein [Luteipulveratus flavus]|uniref:Acyltransferase family protein n=1 Tax=Luteipulveratus flavus TaxID=3031728 RepID=A0ABT6CAL2_9MICO|nr:acyltransferase family protein [Luteipulveratus sp. YIM 133296]MDF8265921.1 acyltransferase family protein [Luteipulveratus sp. YIM 133296]